MKLIVTDIERITVRAPMTPRCEEWNAREVWQWCICEIVRVTTDAGLVGYGETLPHYTWGRVSDEAVARVKGQNAADFLGDDTLGAGLQMAIYDVVGKALGVPAYRLFNQPKVREAVPIAWWNIDFPPEALAEEAKDALAKGYTALKTKARPWWDVYEQVDQMSNVTPPYFKIDMDWNQMLINASNAAPVLNELDKQERVALYESPIFQRDTEGQRLLRRKTQKAIALHFGDPPFPVAVRDEVCDGFVIGGGVARVLREGTMAAQFDKPFFLQIVGAGLTTALSIQLGAVLTHAQWPAVNCLNNYADDLIVHPIQVTEGYAHVPDAPGLGVEVDEAALMKYKMEPPYEIPRAKLLLSIAWPGNRVRHYANIQQCWTDAFAGNIPVQDRGARMHVRRDDGSAGWAEMVARAAVAPFWSSSL
ncbi:MAG: mandelate racemase/muconate lactonizing enzyme family protein [Caldilineaceae bacterium]